VAGWLAAVATHVGGQSSAARALAVTLLVVWGIFLLVTEPGREDRFLGVWPVQVILLAFITFACSSTLRASNRVAVRVGGWLLASTIGLLVIVNPEVVSRLQAWSGDGWAGDDAVEVRIAEYVSDRVRSGGRSQAAIGYRRFTNGPPVPPWRMTDARWRSEREFDVPLEYAKGIANSDQCAEGLSAADEYRVVELTPPPGSAGYYFDVPSPATFHLVRRIDNFGIYERD